MPPNSESHVRSPRVRKLSSRDALRVEGLTVGWGRKTVLDGLNFRLDRGARVAVLGPNGAGKSTLFDAITGRLRPRGGVVSMGAEELSGRALHERALLGLGYVPQEASVFAELSVRDNLVAALQSPVAARLGRPGPAEIEDLVAASLERWSLSHLANRTAAVLSGGERRRLEVSRALLLRPRLLLLDEPFTGLDPAARSLLRDGLMELEPAMALVVSDHSAEDVLAVCARVAVLIDGKIVFDGPSGDFLPGAPGYKRYFGG